MEIKTDLLTNELLDGDCPLIRKFSYLQPLNASEIDALKKMHKHTTIIDERRTFLNQGDIHQKCFIVTKGWAYRYSILSNGDRQVINYYLPGDIVSPFALVMPKTSYSVASISRLQVCPFKSDYMTQLFMAEPRLGLLYAWILGREDAMLAEQVVRLGRLSAYKRIAHLLLELFYRLKIVGLIDNETFIMPLTQNLLADTLGLSMVHINRTLYKLRKDNLISVELNRITLLDLGKLKQISDYQGSYLEQIKCLSSISDQRVDKEQLKPDAA